MHTQIELSKRPTSNLPPKLEFSTNNMIHDHKLNFFDLAKLQNHSTTHINQLQKIFFFLPYSECLNNDPPLFPAKSQIQRDFLTLTQRSKNCIEQLKNPGFANPQYLKNKQQQQLQQEDSQKKKFDQLKIRSGTRNLQDIDS